MFRVLWSNICGQSFVVKALWLNYHQSGGHSCVVKDSQPNRCVAQHLWTNNVGQILLKKLFVMGPHQDLSNANSF